MKAERSVNITPMSGADAPKIKENLNLSLTTVNDPAYRCAVAHRGLIAGSRFEGASGVRPRT